MKSRVDERLKTCYDINLLYWIYFSFYMVPDDF